MHLSGNRFAWARDAKLSLPLQKKMHLSSWFFAGYLNEKLSKFKLEKNLKMS